TEEVPADNTSSVEIDIQAFDIEVRQVVSNSTPEEGQLITYTITVENTSSSVGTNIVIRDIVPAGLTYEPGSITGGSAQNDGAPTGTGLQWTINSLAGNASVNLTFQARVNNGAKAAYGTITNTALRHSSDQVDSNAGNDNGPIDIVIQGIDLEISKT